MEWRGAKCHITLSGRFASCCAIKAITFFLCREEREAAVLGGGVATLAVWDSCAGYYRTPERDISAAACEINTTQKRGAAVQRFSAQVEVQGLLCVCVSAGKEGTSI